jgi:ribonuclease R
VLARARSQRGAIEFESGEVRFVLGPAGEVVQAGMLERNDAHKLIEECMIAANVEAAKFLLQRPDSCALPHPRSPPRAEVFRVAGVSRASLVCVMPPWGKVQPARFHQR